MSALPERRSQWKNLMQLDVREEHELSILSRSQLFRSTPLQHFLKGSLDKCKARCHTSLRCSQSPPGPGKPRLPPFLRLADSEVAWLWNATPAPDLLAPHGLGRLILTGINANCFTAGTRAASGKLSIQQARKGCPASRKCQD